MASKTYTIEEWQKKCKAEVGMYCTVHNSIIKRNSYGNTCGNKDELGRWCKGKVDECPTCGFPVSKHHQETRNEYLTFIKCAHCGYSEGMV